MKPQILHTISTFLLFAASSSTQSSISSSSASHQLNCTSDFDCQSGQFCDYQRKVCTCYDDFQLNPFATSGGIRCSPKRLIAAESSGRCTTTSQCALFAECKGQKCECTFVGGTRSGSEPWKCCHRACHTDADCLPYHNFECTEDVGNSSKSCKCKDGFARGHQGNSCIRVMAPLGGQCNSQVKPSTGNIGKRRKPSVCFSDIQFEANRLRHLLQVQPKGAQRRPPRPDDSAEHLFLSSWNRSQEG